jgi:hypothetical protein
MIGGVGMGVEQGVSSDRITLPVLRPSHAKSSCKSTSHQFPLGIWKSNLALSPDLIVCVSVGFALLAQHGPTDVCRTQSELAVMVTDVLVPFVTVAPFASYWKLIPATVDAYTDIGAKYSIARSSATPAEMSFFICSSLLENVSVVVKIYSMSHSLTNILRMTPKAH